jgi:hypothetical protein
MGGFGVLLVVSLAACLVLGFGADRPSRAIVGCALLILAPGAWLAGEGLVHVFADNQPGSLTRGEWIMALRWVQLLLWLAPFATGLVLMRKARGAGRHQPATSIPD